MRLATAVLSIAFAAFASVPASAQRTDNNAVKDAEDAFGTSIGGEQIGIYAPDNVRNFSPIAAGNVRVEGLYFDQQGHFTDRLVEARKVHVGISAQGYPFPAPTGIADYTLRQVNDDALASVAFTYGPYGGTNTEIDAEIPLLGTKLGLIAGIGFHRQVFDFGGTANTESYGVSMRFQPADNFWIQPFYGRIEAGDEEAGPRIFVSGNSLPKPVKGGKFFGQSWADFEATSQTSGVIAGARFAELDVSVGLFRSLLDVHTTFSDLLFETDAQGHVGNRIIVADKGNRFASISGELRLSRIFAEGARRHALRLSVRGRALKRRYGGSAIVSLGESETGVEDARPEPSFAFGEKSADKVRQLTLGLGYELRWSKLGELSLGIQKTKYRKAVTTPLASLPESRADPWLFSATTAAYLTDALALYGGYTRGLEESDVAPPNAINHNEAPPALRTRQYDFGLRYQLSPSLSLIAGYFNVEKPYFNLDPESRFRQLGSIRNSGIEASLAGRLTPRLTVNAGVTYLDSTVSGEQVEVGLIGDRPIGHFKLRSLVNLQWQFPGHDPLTLTARVDSTSARPANRLNTFFVPARSISSLGARYRTTVGKTPVLIRAAIDNIFDKFGWNLNASGHFLPNGPRRYSMTIAADL